MTSEVVMNESIQVREILCCFVLVENLNKFLLQQLKHSKYMYARCLNCLFFIICLPAQNIAPFKVFMQVQLELRKTGGFAFFLVNKPLPWRIFCQKFQPDSIKAFVLKISSYNCGASLFDFASIKNASSPRNAIIMASTIHNKPSLFRLLAASAKPTLNKVAVCMAIIRTSTYNR